jgi:hypothetical protein
VAGVDDVVAGPAVDDAAHADRLDDVVAGAAEDRVVALAADADLVVAVAAADRVAVCAALEVVVAGPAEQVVGPLAAAQCLAGGDRRVQPVRAGDAEQGLQRAGRQDRDLRRVLQTGDLDDGEGSMSRPSGPALGLLA